MNPEVEAKIKGMISERFGVPLEKLVPEATLDSLDIDSLAMIELMFDIEDIYSIDLSKSREPIKGLADVFNEIDKAIIAKAASGA